MTVTDLLAAALLVVAAWLLGDTLGGPNDKVLDVVAVVVVTGLSLGALILPRSRP